MPGSVAQTKATKARSAVPPAFLGRATASRGQRFFTNHETRNTNHGFFSPSARKGRTAGNRRPDHCARRPVTASLFTIVHHCSRLFGIVQQKILPLSQWPLSVHTGNAACKGFTDHETRVTSHGIYAFHESRNTKHGLFSPSVRKGRTIRNPRPDCRPRPAASALAKASWMKRRRMCWISSASFGLTRSFFCSRSTS